MKNADEILGDFDSWPGTACHYEEVRERVRAALAEARDEDAAPPASARCPAATRNGSPCLLEAGHAGTHTCLGGWFRKDGDPEEPLR